VPIYQKAIVRQTSA